MTTSLIMPKVQSREAVVGMSNAAAIVTILTEILAVLIAWGIYPLIFRNSSRH